MDPLNLAERIEKFQASECYAYVKVRQLQWFLRGQQVDLSDKKQLKMLDNIFTISSADKVVNLLGYALNAPQRTFKEDEEVEQLLAHGDMCFVEEKVAKGIRRVVRKIKRKDRESPYCFSLIPLSVVVDYENLDSVYETLLIKIYKTSKCEYVDMTARVYKSLEHFLDTCQLPFSILCFPRDGEHSFDASGEIEIDCRNVGLKNRVFKMTDLVLGAVGIVGSVGAIFASGGLAIPFIAVGVGSAVYSGSRSIAHLVDSGLHGKSVNPFTDITALNNWLMFTVNAVSAVTLGASATATALSTADTTVDIFGQLTMVLKGISAGTEKLSMVDLVVFNVVEWRRLTMHERLALACSICFCFRKVISFHNAERLIRMVRLRQIYNKENAIPLIKALAEMNPREAEQLNTLRDRANIQEDQLFKWISEGANNSQDMLSKARFLLSIDDLCTEQSLHITDFKISRGTVEVESLFEVDPKLMNRIALDKHGGWASLKCPVRATR
ncbi:hypothetical protein pipiens_019400 [Culex pipiens pipiens]|uniref:DUF4781 domain-containing protein n=1 Tax=Culex pipiens pipiens TaxID=38569 RepID=A0ABD1DUD8_CULPP